MYTWADLQRIVSATYELLMISGTYDSSSKFVSLTQVRSRNSKNCLCKFFNLLLNKIRYANFMYMVQ